MNRTLKRPMFRKGGSTGTGITSGLDAPRQGYKIPGTVKPFDMSRVLSDTRSQMTPENLAAYAPYINRPQGEGLSRFLMTTGLDLLGRSPSGNIFQTASLAAQKPLQTLFQDIDEQRLSKKSAEADLFKTLLQGNIDIAAAAAEGSGEAGAKAFAFKEKADDIENTMEIIFNLRQKKKNEGQLSKEDEQLLASKELRLQNLTKTDEVVKSLLSNKDYVDRVVRKIKGILLELKDTDGLPIYEEDGGKKEAKLIEDIQRYYLEFARSGKLPDFPIGSSFAQGGRVGLQMGGEAMTMNQEQPTAVPTMPIDYDTLRARLPKEIGDDIVKLIASSPEALEDFATIATQQDVDLFNQKYNVSLVLPQEA